MEKLDELVAKSMRYEADINKVLVEYVFSCVEYVLKQQLELGLDMLQHCEEIIESASKQGIIVESEVLTLISHTYALYFYHKQDIQNATVYLFKSIQIFKQRSLPSKPLHQILQNRILCSLHLQLYGLYTSISNTDLALLHIKESLKKSEEILLILTSICSDHMHRHKSLYSLVLSNQLKHPQYSLHDSPHYKLFHQLVLKSLPILLFIQNKHAEPPKIETDWVPPVTLSDLYKMQPFDFSILCKPPELLEEFQEESLLYKVNIHTSLSYLIAETCKKIKNPYQHWIDQACKCARILPKEWFICQVLGKVMNARGKGRSVKQSEGLMVIRKSSFSPDRQVWKSSTPSHFNHSGKNSFEFSKRLKYRSKML